MTTNSVQNLTTSVNALVSVFNQLQQMTATLTSDFETILQSASAQTQSGAVLTSTTYPVNTNATEIATNTEGTKASSSSTANTNSLLDALRNAGQSLATTAASSTAVSSEGINEAIASLSQISTASSPVTQPAVNAAAVAAAKADGGLQSNGLTLYAEDPTSHAWLLKNVNDPTLRRQLDSLPLGRESTLNVLSANDPYQAIGQIYKKMGTYSTVEAEGKFGGQTITVRDHEGNSLESYTWSPSTTGDNAWNSSNAQAIKNMLSIYGVDLPAQVDLSNLSSVSSNLDQRPPEGEFIQSPTTQWAKYGFKTDPLTGQVVGGGSTSAIEYYQETGLMPPPEQVWA